MKQLDCVTIGYYEPEFEVYEKLIRAFGEDSESYRDLRFSFVDFNGRKMSYTELLNYCIHAAGGDDPQAPAHPTFKSGDIPNLAAAYLTSYLRRRRFNARYVNLFQFEKAKLRAFLEEEDPLCVAITTTFYGVNDPVIEIIETIRRYNSRTRIIVGGPLIANHHRRYPPDQFLLALQDMEADLFVIESQGEWTLAQIVQCLKEDGDLGRVPNIVYRDGGRLRINPRVPESNSLDENYIDWTAFSDEDLGQTIQTRTARSCAFACAFCAYPVRAGRLTLASLETVEKELDSIHALGTVKNVVFIDDTFNVPLNRFKEICRLLIRKQYGFDWFSYFRCSNVDQESIDLMAESGCKGVFLGIESGSPTILKNMNKAAKIEQYARGIERLRRHQVLTFGSFIVGFPGETEETIEETADFIQQTKLDYYRAQLWYCEPGTPVYMEKEKYDIEGEGFTWTHDTMESLVAMDEIDRMFLSIDGSRWLPQFSFDFWIIPYLLGKSLSLEKFGDFMDQANMMLKLDIASVPESTKRRKKQEALDSMVSQFAEIGEAHEPGQQQRGETHEPG